MIEKVYGSVLHNFLVERAIGGFVVVESVLPATWILTRLIFAAPNILSEIDLFHWRHIKSHTLSQVLERDLAISVTIEPCVKFFDL